MPRVAAIIVNLVPYHHARWDACAVVMGSETHLVELTDRDEFKVLEFANDARFRRHTLFPKTEPMVSSLERKMDEKLNEIRPDVICVSGWGLQVSLAAIKWAVTRSVPIVMLSESNEFDEARSPIKEWIKRRLVGLCSAGLAGGSPQADYLVKLGMPREHVFVGYDVIDNEYFGALATQIRRSGIQPQVSGLEISNPYFLACARFGKKKNLSGLIRAYSRYRISVAGKAANHNSALSSEVSSFIGLWDLVIAGEGEERAEIERTIRQYEISEYVHLVGAKGYADLPGYYANAGAFIHASTTEQWGLVVNEAMACGLPVLVSNRCGCASDLVKEGENGWTFDPTNEQQIADLMLRIASDEIRRKQMGLRSREIISKWGPDRFASGVQAAVEAALAAPRSKAGLLDRLILRVMTYR
jgi:glycosyltransferase involved in cell wall biosynthesis